MNYIPAIVIVAFNRPNNLKKLLSYLDRANLNTLENVPLIISIDYQDSTENRDVIEIANTYQWKFGKKLVITHDVNIGLRNHIIKCGDLTKTYKSIILLEDDILVAPAFYQYAKRAVDFYDKEEQIAGISLYAYEYEELNYFKVYPNNKGKRTYFMQWAASWGQLWTDNQWQSFRTWYDDNNDISSIQIPDRVKNWNNSWKKFYIAYLVETNRFFVYPYISYTTIKDELGTHIKTDAQVNQVKISGEKIIDDNNFSVFSENDIHYDSFFQPINRELYIEALQKKVNVCFDLFGTKTLNNLTAEYVFTFKNSSSVISRYSNKLIPYEFNLENDERGDVFIVSKKSDLIEKSSFLEKGNILYKFRRKNSIKDMLMIVISKVLSIFN